MKLITGEVLQQDANFKSKWLTGVMGVYYTTYRINGTWFVLTPQQYREFKSNEKV